MPRTRFNLTPRDLAITEVLARRVRVLTDQQIARHWFGGSRTLAARRVIALAQSGLVERFTMRARPELELSTPLFAWTPGNDAPNFAALSHLCCERWKQPVISTAVVAATMLACVRQGVPATRKPRRSEISHDITLAGLYLRIAVVDAACADSWRSEATLRGDGFGDRQKLPDAIAMRNDRSTIIELGGTYPAYRLEELHTFCCEQTMPYELW